MAIPEEEVRTARRELTRQQILLLVGGLVLLLALFWFLFLRGGDEEAPPVTAPVPVTESPAPPLDMGKDGPAQEPGDRPVENFQVFAPRDPFKPLVDLDEGGAAEGEAMGDETAGEDVDGDGDVDEEDGVATAVTGDDDDGDRTETVQGHTVKLVATTEDGKAAQIQVDDTVYSPEEGETFARNFKLVSVSDECATLLYGDDQFSLCEGEEILK